MNTLKLILLICIVFHTSNGEIPSSSAVTITESSAKDFQTTTSTPINGSALTSLQNLNVTKNEEITPEPLPTPLASKMLRSYIEPPYTIIKHHHRFIKPRSKPRRRFKIPKPVYGPPNFIAGEPISFYKQTDSSELSTLPKIEYETTKPKKNKSPLFNLDSEINIQSIPLVDFKKFLPSNSFDFTKNAYYDKQPIPFNLYENSHLSSEDSFSGVVGSGLNHKNKHEEYYVVNSKTPSENKFKFSPSQSIYNPSESYEIPSSISYSPPNLFKPSYIPSESVDGISSSISDSSKIHIQSSYDPPSHSYDSDLKSFAEPPVDIHYTYGTEYEINPLPPSTNVHTYSGPKYLPPESTQVSSYSVKPSSEIPVYKEESQHTVYSSDGGTGYFAEPPNHDTYDHDSYAPIENSNLPLDNDKTTTYDYTKSSYEVPIYNPPNTDAKSASQVEYYPPNIPNNHHNTEQNHNSAKGSNKVENSVWRNATRNTIRTKNHPQATLTENNSSTSENLPNSSGSDYAIEYVENSMIPTSTLKPKQKRKRTRTPPTSKTHNLDTDELRDAFISETRQRPQQILPLFFQPTPLEPIKPSSDQNEGEKFKNTYSNANNNNHYSSENSGISSYAWEPMKVKETNKNKTTLKLRKKSPILAVTTNSPKNHPPMPTKDIEVISIQKSKSKSYYDGTISPEVYTELDRGRSYSKLINTRDNSNDFVVLSSNVMVSNDNNNNRSFKLKGSVIDDTLGRETNPKHEFWTGEVPRNHRALK